MEAPPSLNTFSDGISSDVKAFLTETACKMPDHGITWIDEYGKKLNVPVPFGSTASPAKFRNKTKESELVVKREELLDTFKEFCAKTGRTAADTKTMLGHLSEMKCTCISCDGNFIIIEVIGFCKHFDPARIERLHAQNDHYLRCLFTPVNDEHGATLKRVAPERSPRAPPRKLRKPPYLSQSDWIAFGGD